MKIVVDTNIVFSGILNSSNKIGKILILPNNRFTFYSSNFLKTELLKHRNKLLKLTRLSENELQELELLITSKITFIHEGLIPGKILSSAEKLVTGIDIDDMLFVALSKMLKAKLWTGDKELYAGLKAKKFRNVITTEELWKLFNANQEN